MGSNGIIIIKIINDFQKIQFKCGSLIIFNPFPRLMAKENISLIFIKAFYFLGKMS